MREPKCGVIARDGGRHCKKQRERGANEGRPQCREGDLSDKEGDAAGDCADDDRYDRTRTGVIGGKSCCHASRLCGVPRYVAHGHKAFLCSTRAGFLRHIFSRG
jgi:hypothetical protein